MLLFIILYSVTVFDFRKAIKKAIHGAKFGQAPKRNDLWGFAPIVKVSRDITTEIMEMWQEWTWESLPDSMKEKRLLFLVARQERNERLIRHICIKTLNKQNCSLLLSPAPK